MEERPSSLDDNTPAENVFIGAPLCDQIELPLARQRERKLGGVSARPLFIELRADVGRRSDRPPGPQVDREASDRCASPVGNLKLHRAHNEGPRRSIDLGRPAEPILRYRRSDLAIIGPAILEGVGRDERWHRMDREINERRIGCEDGQHRRRKQQWAPRTPPPRDRQLRRHRDLGHCRLSSPVHGTLPGVLSEVRPPSVAER